MNSLSCTLIKDFTGLIWYLIASNYPCQNFQASTPMLSSLLLFRFHWCRRCHCHINVVMFMHVLAVFRLYVVCKGCHVDFKLLTAHVLTCRCQGWLLATSLLGPILIAAVFARGKGVEFDKEIELSPCLGKIQVDYHSQQLPLKYSTALISSIQLWMEPTFTSPIVQWISLLSTDFFI